MAKSNNDKYQQFIRLRFGLKEHIKTGRMQGRDLGLYVALHYHADYQTGVVHHTSAPFLANFLQESVHKIRRGLCRLEKGGYIRRFGHRGKVSGYDILIDRYLLLNCILTDARNTHTLQEIAFTVIRPCKLCANQVQLKCELSANYALPILDIKILRVLDVKDNRGKSPSPSRSFTPPTADEVQQYVEEKGYDIDPRKFYDYFTESGWVDSKGKKVRNWKQKVISWSGTRQQPKEETAIPELQTPSEEVLALIRESEGGQNDS